jgi:tetratricopeptide (TPR) repeat protein
MAASRPLLGWGVETYSTEFPRFQSRDLARAYPDFYYESPHNIFLDAFVSTGVLGLVGLLAICALGLVCGWLARKTAPAEALMFVAGLIASLVAQQFTAFTVATALCLYLAIAVLVSLTVSSQPVVRRRWMFSALGVAFCVLGVRLIFADTLLARTNVALQRGDLDKAMELHSDSRGWQTPTPYSDLWYSRALAQRAAMTQEGYIAAERAAIAAEDRHNAYYNLAMHCALRNDAAGVEANLREAIRWAPNWFKPHWTLAKSLKVAGRVNEAEKELAIALDLDAGVHEEVQQDRSR